MTELDKLKEAFDEFKITNMKIFPGSDRNVTAEEVVKQINNLIDEELRK